MPINNPTNGNESQFKPTLPTDSNPKTYPGKTFDLTKEQLLTSNPTYNTLFKPTLPTDSSLVSYPLPTFNLINEDLILNNPTFPDVNALYTTIPYGEIISQFVADITINSYESGIYKEVNIEYANPTTPKVDVSHVTVAPGNIESQFVKKTEEFPTGIYGQINTKNLYSLNPVNPANQLPKNKIDALYKSSNSEYSIQSQFFPIYYGTGNFETDLFLKNTADKAKNAIFKIPGLAEISNFTNLPTNTSKASNIIIDKEFNADGTWAKAAAAVGLNLSGTGTSQYATLNLSQLYNNNPGGLSDFRVRKRSNIQKLLNVDFDKINLKPTSTLTLKHGQSSDLFREGNGYYQSYADGKEGVYKYFNLTSTYGFGDQGAPGRGIRQDFTRISNIHTEGDSQYNFRGDIITAIPTKFMSYSDTIKYKKNKKTREFSKDLIKFFFTGPNVLKNNGDDDVMVFRALITSLTDTHNPQWNAQQMIGRADPNYHYSAYSRELSLDFTVYASDRDEMKPIWQKLNMLAGYTTPSYREVAPKAPWMRITIGDLFVQQPAIINSLSYTLHDSDTTWEINIEQDPWMNQLPHKISVSIGFNLITDYLPQKNGRFYTLNENSKYDWLPDLIKPRKPPTAEELAGINWEPPGSTPLFNTPVAQTVVPIDAETAVAGLDPNKLKFRL